MYAAGAKISRSGRPICFSKTRYYYDTVPFGVGGACIFRSTWWQGGYERINGVTRVLELAADNGEAAPRKGARSTSTNALEVE
jgi:hypothetical protein